MVSWFALPACLFMMAAQGTPIPVILDTDIGDDIDDTWALAMLLGRPELDLKLIVTATVDTPARTQLVAKMLERMGRTDVPIGTGKKTGDNPHNQTKWMEGYDFSAYSGKVHDDGVGAMVDIIHASKSPVTIIAIGPQTNLKAALDRDPSIAQNARIVLMAGSIEIGYAGKQGRAREWNVLRDIEAARAVFAAPWAITMAPLDVCGTLMLRGDPYTRVAESKTPRATVVIENYRDWKQRNVYPEDSSSILYDTVAVYLAFDEAHCTLKTLNLSIDDKGETVPDENGRPVRCALGWNDREAFVELLVQTLTASPQSSD